MYNRNDPRFRRTLNQISQNFESANESAQVGLFSFSENYIKPCFGAFATCVEPYTAACFPKQRDRMRRHHQARTNTRGRLEHSFDFYDDWEEDENDALLSLEDDEFDRVVVGYGTHGDAAEPRARRGILGYGARTEARPPRARRKSAVLPYDVGPDPTVIPNQSYFGFLSKLPFKIGGGGLRYKPSAADLQVRPKGATKFGHEVEPLLEEEEEEEEEGEGAGGSHGPFKTSGRARSGTTSSGHTTDSYSSRGDIFPSDDEDDAVPIDDEFTIALERRTTNSGHDDSSNGKGGSRRHTDAGHPPSDPPSSKNSQQGRKKKRKSASSTPRSASSDPEMGELATLSVLKQEEQKAHAEAEGEIEMKRNETQQLAMERGLATSEHPGENQELEHKIEKPTAQASRDLVVSEDAPTAGDITAFEITEDPITMEDNEQHRSSQSNESE